MKPSNKGSALAVMLIIILALGIIIASVTGIVAAQRRIAIHREAALIANNTAETALDYAYSFILKDSKLNVIGSTNSLVPGAVTAGNPPAVKAFTFPTGSEAANFLFSPPVAPPALSVNASGPVTPYSDSLSNVNISLSNLKMLVESPITYSMYQVDGTAPANANSPIKNQWVKETVVPIIAQVTATFGNQSYTAYMRKSIDIKQINLFQDAIFFQGSLMLHRGYPDLGAIHTNGNLAINCHNGDTAVYSGQISAALRFFRGQDFESSVGTDGPYAYNPIVGNGDYTWNLVGTQLAGASGGIGTVWGYGKITLNGKVLDNASPPTDSTNTNWTGTGAGSYAQFSNNLLDASHKVPVINPTGSSNYSQDDPSTPTINEFSNGPYSIIEPFLPTSYNTDHASTPARPVDNSNNLEARSSLILRIECTKSGGITATNGFDIVTGDATAGNPLRWNIPAGHSFGEYFVVKAYKNSSSTYLNPNIASPPALVAVALPMEVIGQADNNMLNSVSTDFTSSAASKNIFASTKTVSRILGPGQGNGAAGLNLSPPSSGTGQWIKNGDGTFESYSYNSTGASTTVSINSDTGTYKAPNNTVATGLHDSRLGRGVNLLTIDIGKLKRIMEASYDPLTPLSSPFASTAAGKAAQEFRDTFNVNTEWNGVIYVEFPTSLTASTTASTNAINSAADAFSNCGATDGVTSYAFNYGTPEKRNPDRMGCTEDTTSTYVTKTLAKAPVCPANSRKDMIIPIAPQLRAYPTAYDEPTLESSTWAIPALQIINAQLLPNTNPTYQADTNTNSPIWNSGSMTIGLGFTIATNAPIYLVGSYNSDGNTSTPYDYTSSPSNLKYPIPDSTITAPDGSALTGAEVPSAIFCDTLTVLSNNWEINRPKSEPGSSGSATTRMVPLDPAAGSGAVEISACIATGEYPIFEFWMHGLEDWTNYYYGDGAGTNDALHHNPIVIRGSACGMFHSEIQHIKQAYSRDKTLDIQNYWSDAGAFAIPAVRFSQWLADGVFPPGAPTSAIYDQRDFRLLRAGNAADMTIIQQAGLTVQSGAN